MLPGPPPAWARSWPALEGVRAELDAIEVPRAGPAAYNAVAEWEEAEADGDIDSLRRWVRHAFPDLALTRPAPRGDASIRPIPLAWHADQ